MVNAIAYFQIRSIRILFENTDRSPLLLIRSYRSSSSVPPILVIVRYSRESKPANTLAFRTIWKRKSAEASRDRAR